MSPVNQALRFGKGDLAIYLPGAGFGFWHQFGQLHGLFSDDNTSPSRPDHSHLVGVSAGALAATLFACGVKYEDVYNTALECVPSNNNELSLTSCRNVPQIVATWLDRLLPTSNQACVDLTRGVFVATATCPTPFTFQQNLLHSFTSREALISALSASIAIPLLSEPCWIQSPCSDQSPTKHFDAMWCQPNFEQDYLRIECNAPFWEVAQVDGDGAANLYSKGFAEGRQRQVEARGQIDNRSHLAL